MEKLLGEGARQRLTKLKGKWALRTAPIEVKTNSIFQQSYSDRSYISDPVLIVDVTDTHVVYVSSISLFVSDNVSYEILDSKFYDDCWVECPEIVSKNYQNKLDKLKQKNELKEPQEK